MSAPVARSTSYYDPPHQLLRFPPYGVAAATCATTSSSFTASGVAVAHAAPLLRLLYRAWKYHEPYDPEQQQQQQQHEPHTTTIDRQLIPLTLEQQPSYFVQQHPFFGHWENGLLATALELLTRVHGTIDGGDDAAANTPPPIQSVYCTSHETHAPWLWALRLHWPGRLWCVRGTHGLPATAPWFSNDPIDSTGLMVDTDRTPSAQWSIVMDARRRDLIHAALAHCADTGTMIVHYCAHDADIQLHLVALNNCFRRVHLHRASRFMVPDVHRGEAWVWIGICKRIASPFTHAILQWLSHDYDGSGLKECVPGKRDPQADQATTFAEWTAYVQRQSADQRAPSVNAVVPTHKHDDVEEPDDVMHARVSLQCWPTLFVHSTTSSMERSTFHLDNPSVDNDDDMALTLYAQTMAQLWPSTAPVVCVPCSNQKSDDAKDSGDPSVVWQTCGALLQQWMTAPEQDEALVRVVQDTTERATWVRLHGPAASSSSCSGSTARSIATHFPLGSVFIGRRCTRGIRLIDIIRLSPTQQFIFRDRETRHALLNRLVATCGSGDMIVCLDSKS